jgi:hypothetical protein
LDRSATNCSSTRSARRWTLVSGTAVLNPLPRTPLQALTAHQSPTVHLATRILPRFKCFQDLQAPYARRFSCQTRWISGSSSRSHRCRQPVLWDNDLELAARNRSMGQSAVLADRLDPKNYPGPQCTGTSLASAVKLHLRKICRCRSGISLARSNLRFSGSRSFS